MNIASVAEYLLGLGWLFGSLVFWPATALYFKCSGKWVQWFKRLFWFQVIGLISTFAVVRYYQLSGNRDWLHSLILPYAIGSTSWLIAIAIIISIPYVSAKERANESVE